MSPSMRPRDRPAAAGSRAAVAIVVSMGCAALAMALPADFGREVLGVLIGQLVVDVGILAPLEWFASLFPPVGLDDPGPAPRYPNLGFGLHVLIAASVPLLVSAVVAWRQGLWRRAVRNSEAWLAMRALLDGPALSETQRAARDWLEARGVEAGPAPAQAPVPAPRDDDFSQAESEAARFLQGLKTAR